MKQATEAATFRAVSQESRLVSSTHRRIKHCFPNKQVAKYSWNWAKLLSLMNNVPLFYKNQLTDNPGDCTRLMVPGHFKSRAQGPINHNPVSCQLSVCRMSSCPWCILYRPDTVWEVQPGTQDMQPGTLCIQVAWGQSRWVLGGVDKWNFKRRPLENIAD